MKHKITASNLSAFNILFDALVGRIEQVDDIIVKTRFNFNNDIHSGYRATVWTKHEIKKEESNG